ncbi:hypothetical protein SHKM778_95350 (plasmid) [Streptomyces sp. KM77-8]|uniref:AAA+ ATPase domain-containing protein n=1 Tax=Streptomyces haneummycinicus TaxID=3074435 RepID=A0AAT9I0K0_9ACTN
MDASPPARHPHPALEDRIRRLVADHPRTLLIVGYSERDRVVVDQLIAPLDQGWRVCRIGPEAGGTDDIAGPADSVLPALASDVRQQEAASVWYSVPFTGKRDIGAALAGERLGPADVDACPRLMEVDLLVDALRRRHSVVLNGDSGCGKSITAYQALREILQDGYEVLRLRDDARRRGVGQWMADLAHYPHRKALLIDDAQDLSPDLIRELAETATQDQLVLIVAVDHVGGGVTTYRISDPAAVGTLARAMRERAHDILPQVRALDDFVGDQIGDEPLLDRLAEAARADSAWQFFYTLTGGWRRTERDALDLRGHDRADLLLLALAVAQVASVDAGVTADDLEPYAHALGRDRSWIDRSLGLLQDKHLATCNDNVLRCAHLRTAWALITWMLHPPRHQYAPPPPVVIPPIESAAAPHQHRRPLRPAERHDLGLYCPTNRPKQTARPPQPSSVSPWTRRTHRCAAPRGSSAVTTHRKRGGFFAATTPSPAPAFARWPSVRSPPRWRRGGHGRPAPRTPHGIRQGRLHRPDQEHHAQIAEWVHHVTPENGWAIGTLINALSNDDQLLTQQLLADVDPHALARLIPGAAGPTSTPPPTPWTGSRKAAGCP